MEYIYMLIDTEAGELEKVLEEILKKPNVLEAHVVTGAYDIIAKVQTPYVAEAIGSYIAEIRKIKGVKSTETLVCVERIEK
jgi:DNA-binding Lrp family transcriptional regulator